MTDSSTPMADTEEWTEFVEEMNESMLSAMEQNMEAQARFVETWLDTVETNTSEERVTEGLQGYARAYEAWMRAAQEQYERAADAFSGEEVNLDEFRDIWLNTANESFKEVMSTTAFAATTGETVGDALELQAQVDEAAQDTLHTLGFATEGDIDEVGERLLELERRQHAVEEKLDRVLDALES
ncbi:poly(R)-hydroxyalkanoic acid synthase subunit [Halobacteriaceae archaeon GCM10025711]